MANKPFTGVNVIQISKEEIDKLYKNKKIELPEAEYPNLFIVFKSEGSNSALARVDATGKCANLIPDKLTASGIKAKNKEQAMALDMLLDDNVPINILTGRSGSGKTICALAVALAKYEAGKYKKIILTRPMSQVGGYELGILPGTVAERFSPYLGNFYDNLIQLAGKDLETILEQFNIECLPIQLMRGRSLMDTFIICDEVQVLDFNEMRTLGTRVGANSKIVIMGDLAQIDRKLTKQNTGLYKLMHSEIAKESGIIGAIELLKVERSIMSKIFGDIFEEK
jgi:PhoH-like ATPase